MSIPADDDRIEVKVTRCVELETGLDVHFGDLDPSEQDSAKHYAAMIWGHERLPRFFPDEMEQARDYLEQCQDIANTAEYEADLAATAYAAAMRKLKNAKCEIETWKALWTPKNV